MTTTPPSDDSRRRSVAVLAGGLSHERDISLKSGSRLAHALRERGYDVAVLDPDSNLLPWLLANRPDVAVSTLHGGRGENGDIQTVLELAGIPHVGSHARDCRLAFDKTVAKAEIVRAGYATPSWVTLGQLTFRDLGPKVLLQRVVEVLELPLIVKPNMGGSALGVSIVHEPEELSSALIAAFAYCDTVIVERLIVGTEVAVVVIDVGRGPLALPPVQIEPSGELYDYESRYTAGYATYYAPAEIDASVSRAVEELSLAAHKELRMRHLSRTDIIVDQNGTPYFLECTMSPGLTETSVVNLAIDLAGQHDLGELYSGLISAAATLD